MHEKMSGNLEFVFGVCIFLFVIAGGLCCCYINPMICQQARHRQKIFPIQEKKRNAKKNIQKEEKVDDVIINPIQITIV